MKRSMLLTLLIFMASLTLAGAQDFVWLEGEKPTKTNFDVPTHGWGKPEYLSGGAWLTLGDNHAKNAPEDGVLMDYDFEISEAGNWEFWGRMAFITLWYPFEYKIDDGQWTTVPRDIYPRVDSMPIDRFNKLAWVRFTATDLSAGKHTLHMRLKNPEKLDVEGKKPRFLYGADAFCFYKGSFKPNGKVKPGEDWRSEEDLQAEKHVFQIPEASKPGVRVEQSLEGLWQFGRYDDPGQIEEAKRLGPIEDAPDDLHWSSIQVPGDRDDVRPDMLDAHRFFYRTRVFVPESHEGRSFFLEFPMNNMITTVFVNGKMCGWTRAPYAVWRCDISEAVKAGQENDIRVGIKDLFYGISPKFVDDGDIRNYWRTPLRENQGYITNVLDMPEALMGHTGMLDRPLFVSSGKVYTDDAFVKTSVSEKKIDLELEIQNPTDQAMEVSVVQEVTPWKGGDVEKRFADQTVTVPAFGLKKLAASEPWENPKLWWPDEPNLYVLTTTLKSGDEIIDIKKTRFGFREWDWSTTRFKLNGVVWKLWQTGHTHHDTPEEMLADMRATNQDVFRWRIGLGESREKFAGLNLREFLNFADENGIIVRPTFPFEGMFGNYQRNPADVPELWDHTAQMVGQIARGLRNHCSIMVWSLQNEVVLINIRSVDRGAPWMDMLHDAVVRVDPTRPTMNDGAGATGKIPVTGIHYPAVSTVRHYPDEAYTWEVSLDQKGGNRHGNRAVLDMTKPVFVGEGYYTGGKSIGWFASVDGEECYRGIAYCENARQLMGQIYTEGWRWQGVAGADLLTGAGYFTDSFAPVALFCRQWDWTHASGETVIRTLKVFNMTRHADPITAKWILTVDGKTAHEGSREFNLAPGTSQEFAVEIPMPATDSRLEGELALVCERKGEEVFRAVKNVSIIDPDQAKMTGPADGQIVVIEKTGEIARRLKARGVAFTAVDGPAAVPANAKLVIVGPNALDKDISRDKIWRDLAASGKRLIVLDQDYPLLGSAVDADVKSTDFTGSIAFIENAIHPVFQGLMQKDLFTRSKDHTVYRRVYEKPTQGARSLIQCDSDLNYSALLEAHVNDGLMLLCQAAVGSKLDSDPVFQLLFDNMVSYALDYERVINPVAVAMEEGHDKLVFLENLKLAFRRYDDPMEAIESGIAKIVVVDATQANLRKMADNLDTVRAFTENGGWIMCWGVTPDGIEHFNKLAGVDHLIRPFRQERVNLRRPLDPLAIGISEGDIAMTTGQRYMRFSNTEIPSSDAFTHAVDYTDIAPFCEYPDPKYFKHMEDDPVNNGHAPINMVNNLTHADMWRFIFYLHLFDDSPTKWTVDLPREETVTSFEIIPNTSYHDITKFKLTFDGDPDNPVLLDIEANDDPVVQHFDFEPRKARSVEMEIADWTTDGKNDVLGIDNIWLHAERSDHFYETVHPLATAGVLNRYTQGQGGLVLNQIKLMDSEPNPENLGKKQNIVKNILANLNAAFGEESTADILDVSKLVGFDPVVFGGNQVNLFLNMQNNWPVDGDDLSKLPIGNVKLGGVSYVVFDNPLAPAEANILGLGDLGDFDGPDAMALDVRKKTDGLFFLHTFVQEKAFQPRGDAEANPSVMEYVVTWDDGSKATFPVRLGLEIDNWLQKTPTDPANASVAWQADASKNRKTVLYQSLWTNPHPEKTVQSVQMKITPTGEDLGMGVICGITAVEMR
ncbi:MAG: glycosyl hydrolase 2 galactose-binding domain-containing protein [Candidatus Sumerlaeota bacterium]